MPPRSALAYGLLLALTAASTAANAQPRRIRWSVAGRSHVLRLGPSRDVEYVPVAGRPHTYVRSIVGPMVSTFVQQDWVADNGGYTTQAVELTLVGGYVFSLRSFLAASGQTARVTAQLEDDPRLEAESFWIHDWDGDEVTLGIPRNNCEAQRSTCYAESVLVRIEPPAAWRPWLDAARAGRGLLFARLGTR